MSDNKLTRTLSAAERKRRRDRSLQKRFRDAGGAAEPLSEIERRCPSDVSPALLEVALLAVRRRLRSRKRGVYGSNIAKEVERLFGPLDPDHRAFFVEWVNWLVRNRGEVGSGRYSGKNAPSTIASMIAGVGNVVVTSAASATPSTRAKTDEETSINRSIQGGAPGARDHLVGARAADETVEGQSAQAYESGLSVAPPLPTETSESIRSQLDDDEAFRAARAKLEREARSSNAKTKQGSLCADSPGNSQGALDLGDPSGPKRPAPFSFTFKVEGETDANDFFRTIYQDKPIDDILAAAIKLARNPSAVEAIIRRGNVEANYLAKAMADLGVDLP